MVEYTGLENRQDLTVLVGSNPTPSDELLLTELVQVLPAGCGGACYSDWAAY